MAPESALMKRNANLRERRKPLLRSTGAAEAPVTQLNN